MPTRRRVPAAPALVGSLLLLVGCADGDGDGGSAPVPAPESEPRPGATVAWTLDERDLLPESLALDPATGDLFVGSTRKGKIVRVRADGTTADFAGPREHGLWMVMGMEVDAERRHLWVASSDGDNLEGYRRGRGRAAGVFQFDVDSGALLRSWTFDDGSTHFFNDLVVADDGTVYVTHMFNQPAVWVLAPGADAFEVFARPGGFRNPNGLALDPHGGLWVAHQEGVSRFDRATAERLAVADPQGRMATPADGLYWHRGALIGVHPQEGVVRRYRLDAAGTTIVDADLLAEDDPELDDPTTGVVVDDRFYYVANSQFGRLDGGALPPVDALDPVVIAVIELGG